MRVVLIIYLLGLCHNQVLGGYQPPLMRSTNSTVIHKSTTTTPAEDSTTASAVNHIELLAAMHQLAPGVIESKENERHLIMFPNNDTTKAPETPPTTTTISGLPLPNTERTVIDPETPPTTTTISGLPLPNTVRTVAPEMPLTTTTTTTDQPTNKDTETTPIPKETHALNDTHIPPLSENSEYLNKEDNKTLHEKFVDGNYHSNTEKPPPNPDKHTQFGGEQKEPEKTSSTPKPYRSLEDKEDKHHLPHQPSGLERRPSRNDLCSSCLCDPSKKNVFCKHEHVYGGKSHHLTLKQELIPHQAKTLHILNFEEVTITNGTFSSDDLKLQLITFENIGLLHLSEESLLFSDKAKENTEVGVIIINCNITEIPMKTFTQYSVSDDQRNDIKLEMTRFLSLRLERNNITTIRSKAFYQARLLDFTMMHTKIGSMEENCIDVDIYHEWTIEDCHLPMLVTNAIHLRTQLRVIFSNNTMAGLENRSLNILAANQVLFEYNFVLHLKSEALVDIRPYEDTRGASIVFLNNTIAKAENKSLAVNNRYPPHERKVLNNKFNTVCNCELENIFKQLLGISEKSDFRDQELYQSVTENSLCQRQENLKLYMNIDNYIKDDCNLPIPLPIIISAATVMVTIIITVIVCVICNRQAQRAKEEANYLGECCYSQSFSTLHSNFNPLSPPPSDHQCHSWDRSNPLQPWVMAVPEVKTYQETEVHVHYEHTEPMTVNIRDSYPKEPRIDLLRKSQARSSCPFN